MKNVFIKNAVLRKDMMLDMKKPKIMVIMLLFNILLCLVAFPFVASTILMTGSESALSYRTLITMYMVLVWLETVAICFLTPALTAGCVSIEKERQTMDVLLTTRMSTWQIIKGKYLSSIMLVIMLIISGLPIMSLVFIYGGINIGQMFLMTLVLITTTMYLASFGVFFSALVKNTIVSVILTYMAIGFLFSMTFTGAFGAQAAILGFNETLEWEYNIDLNLHGDYFLFLLWWNPLVTVFDSTAQIFGYGFDSSSTFNGMQDLAGDLFVSMTDKNIFLNLWTIISMAVQLGTSYLLLRWSAYLIKPVKRKPKKFESNLKNVPKRKKAEVEKSAV
ncbi:MAG: ABC transporter permease [Lachnospiraceae bacterium]|nr:ABC transporter permease [Lachnospiraceae bacterium]